MSAAAKARVPGTRVLASDEEDFAGLDAEVGMELDAEPIAEVRDGLLTGFMMLVLPSEGWYSLSSTVRTVSELLTWGGEGGGE